MPIPLNGAGLTAGNPIMNGLPMQIIFGASTPDVATLDFAYIESVTGGTTNDQKANLSPAATTILNGITGSYADTTTDQITITDTTGFSPGDFIYLEHASIVNGEYEINAVVSGTALTLVGNPLDGVGDISNITYQNAWRLVTTAGGSGMVSALAGDENFARMLASDGGTVQSTQEESFFVADQPAGSAFITLEGGNPTGTTATDSLLTLAINTAWAANGGITHMAMANHGTQGVNNFTWQTGGGTAEVDIATAEGGLTASAGDGAKYGRLIFRSTAGGASTLVADISITVDSTGPSLFISLHGV